MHSLNDNPWADSTEYFRRAPAACTAGISNIVSLTTCHICHNLWIVAGSFLTSILHPLLRRDHGGQKQQQ